MGRCVLVSRVWCWEGRESCLCEDKFGCCVSECVGDVAGEMEEEVEEKASSKTRKAAAITTTSWKPAESTFF